MSGIMSMLLGAVSSAAAAVDEFFNRVTLLLPGNGTNGAQNNTFLDSSSNNFTITRNGNTTQGTFSPFSQTGWSNAFSVSGTYLTATQSAFAAAGDFTVEAWFWQNNQTSGFQGIVSTSTSGNSSGFRITTDNGTLTLWVNNSSVTSASVPQNQWNHVAISRTGTATNNISCYLNGVRVGQFTNTSSTTNTTLTVGRYYYDLANYYIDGYISNVRLVVGSGLYSGSTISVPTTPLTAVSGTQVLTCQSNRFIDSSSNAFALTVNGTLSVQAFSPFAPTAAYSAATVGGSGYFDGTGDFLATPSNTAFDLGTGDFTLECWVYATSTPSDVGIFESRTDGNSGTTNGFTLTAFSSSVIRIFSGSVLISSSGTSYVNTWCHVAVTRVSGTFNLYINGVSQGTSATARTLSNTDAIIGGGRYGTTSAVTAFFPGYIANCRIIKGQSLTTGNFTPPTSPITTNSVGWTGANVASSITGTVSLLLNYTNAGITDATAKNDLETVGNAQISTTQSKFGGSSMYFDGTGDYLLLPSSPNFAFSGDFTVEAWVYLTANIANGTGGYLTDFRVSSTSNYALGFLGDAGVTKMYSFIGAVPASTTGTSTVTLNTWNHVAYVRSGGVITMYLNGVANGTLSNSFSQGATSVTICSRFNGATEYVTGYIDDLRVSRFARYTANFTPTTTAFPLQ